MLKKLLVGLIFSSAFSVLLLAQTQPKVQIDEALSGKEAKEMLQNFPKEVKSAIKMSKIVRGGNAYPWSSLVFDENTEAYITLNNSAGNPILIVLYTKNSPGIMKTDNLKIDDKALQMRCEEPNLESKNECCPQYKNYVVHIWDKATQTFKPETVCPYVYYNGGRNTNAEYTEWGLPYTNSFGLWIKLGGYFTTPITLFDRNETNKKDEGYRTEYFLFQVLESGKLSVTTKSLDYSTESIVTNKPIPLNKWVYVQAMQSVKNYTIGWKAQDGSDEEIVTKTFITGAALEDLQLKNRRFNVASLQNYIKNGDNRFYLNVKEVFYEPTIQQMFALMNNYNAKEKLIFSSGSVDSISLATLAIEAYKILIGEGSSIITIKDFDIYYDDTTGNILAVDFRVK